MRVGTPQMHAVRQSVCNCVAQESIIRKSELLLCGHTLLLDQTGPPPHYRNKQTPFGEVARRIRVFGGRSVVFLGGVP